METGKDDEDGEQAGAIGHAQQAAPSLAGNTTQSQIAVTLAERPARHQPVLDVQAEDHLPPGRP